MKKKFKGKTQSNNPAVVMDPANHPATSLPPATEDHWGTQLAGAPPSSMAGEPPSAAVTDNGY